jgi:hypothetical protein
VRPFVVKASVPLGSAVAPADRRLVEDFERDHGRLPRGPEDGEAWRAWQRGLRANLLKQATSPPMPDETTQLYL